MENSKLVQDIENSGKEYLNATDGKKLALKNELAKNLWDYAKQVLAKEYSDIEDFDDSISDSVLALLSQKPVSWIAEFKTTLKRNVFKNKEKMSNKGFTNLSNSVKFAKNLLKWAEYKGEINIHNHQFNSEDLKKLFEYGRSLGKDDDYIKKALLNLSTSFIEGNSEATDSENSNTTFFDFISEKDFADYQSPEELDSRNLKFLLYLKAVNDEYLSKSECSSEKNLKFLSLWYTNLFIATLIRETVFSKVNAKSFYMKNYNIFPFSFSEEKNIETFFDLLNYYNFIDKETLKNFVNIKEWIPNTNRKSLGMQCGIVLSSIGNVSDRFKKAVEKRYENLKSDYESKSMNK